MWGTRPLTERYNNPGALEYQSWMEKYGARLGPNGRYAAFDSPDAGYGVMSKVLDTYQNKHGLNTVAGIVNRWAPSSVDNNSTGTYTQKVAAALGVDPNAPLSPEQRPALMRAMASYESGREAPSPNGLSPASNGQQPMRNPWLGLNWPTDGNAQAGDLNPGMTPGSLLAARLGAAGMFDQVLPEGMSGGHASGGQAMPSSAEMSRAVAGNVSRETSSESKPSLLDTILERAQSPAFQGGMMMFLDAARGGSGIDGYRAGVSGGASMQETMMKDMALKQKAAQEKALTALLNDPVALKDAPKGLVALAQATKNPALLGEYLARDPLDRQHKALQNETLQRNLNAPPPDGSKLIEVNGSIVRVPAQGQGPATTVYGSDPTTQRRQQLVAAKMDPETATSKIFIATGKMPREDQQPLTAHDKKAIIEADDKVMASQNVLSLLDEAMRLNPKAHTGFLAGTRAMLGNNLPDWLVPDAIASPESAAATTNFENISIAGALSQLRTTFGAAPTEGERKILLELQGAINQPVKVREDILRRAYVLAEKRMKEQQGIADGLRGGTFYKQGGGVKPPTATGPAATSAPAPAAVLSEARAAIQRGAPREAVLQRLRDNGIDPAGL